MLCLLSGDRSLAPSLGSLLTEPFSSWDPLRDYLVLKTRQMCWLVVFPSLLFSPEGLPQAHAWCLRQGRVLWRLITACLLSPGPSQTEQELLRLTNTSPIDLLCAPVPSCLPSPQLRPDPVILQSADLIQFEEHPQVPSGGLCWCGCGFVKCSMGMAMGNSCAFQIQTRLH